MKLVVEIELGNDGMRTTDDVGAKLVDIGVFIRHEYEHRFPQVGVVKPILDVNGNTVGWWSFSRGEE